MTLAEFTRIYPLRTTNISWLFGAGTSVSSGLPSAYDLVWEFKRKIYCSEQGYPLSLFSNLSDSGIRNQIQSYFDSKEVYPKEDSLEEYSEYFELAFPNPKDRSHFLAEQLSAMQNGFGHKVIGTLVKNNVINNIFTTNFDKAFENAIVEHFPRMDDWFCASIDNAETSVQLYLSGKRPFITKLHGDYFSEKLKNTTDELKSQDSKLRSILYHSSLSHGLGVMGYSGRDNSIIETLNSALEQDSSFPGGIFWFVLTGTVPIKQVQDFLEKAKSIGVQAEIIEIDSFDSAWGDIIKGIEKIPKTDLDDINKTQARLPFTSLPPKGNKFPYLRLNAISIESYPAVARLTKVDIGGTKEVRERISSKKSTVIGIRKKDGVVGFGPDYEFSRVFETNKKEIYHINKNEINDDDTTIKGLILEALSIAIVRDKPLVYRKRKNRYLIFPNPKLIDNRNFSNLKYALFNDVKGKIPNTDIDWIVACEISIQTKLSKCFLVLNPTVITGKLISEADRYLIAPFIKEKTARWYNSTYNNILTAWIDTIFETNQTITISMFDSSIVGCNATFILNKKSPFSKSN